MMAGRWVVLVAALGTMMGGPVAALETPEGAVLLEVEGDIEVRNAGRMAHFDRAMLEALPQAQTQTHLPWFDGPSSYQGPLLSALLDAVGATGDTLVVGALNDYSAEIPLSDVRDYDVILAMSRDGRPLGVRNQGPLFVIYPFDDHPEILTRIYLTRSVWQVSSILVR